jgi:hypothetical protein
MRTRDGVAKDGVVLRKKERKLLIDAVAALAGGTKT